MEGKFVIREDGSIDVWKFIPTQGTVEVTLDKENLKRVAGGFAPIQPRYNDDEDWGPVSYRNPKWEDHISGVAWFAHTNTFSLTEKTYGVGKSKSTGQIIGVENDWKTVWTVKYVPSATRFDLIFVNRNATTRKIEFKSHILPVLANLPFNAFSNCPEMAECMKAWMLTVSNGKFNPFIYEQDEWATKAAYPMMRHWGGVINQEYGANTAFIIKDRQTLSQAMKMDSLSRFMNKYFKRSKYPKAWAKLAAQNIKNGSIMDLENLKIISMFAHPNNVPALCDANSDALGNSDYINADFVEFMKGLSFQRQLRIVKEERWYYMVNDAVMGAQDLARAGVIVDIAQYPTATAMHQRVADVRERLYQERQREGLLERQQRKELENQRKLALVIPEEGYIKLLNARLPEHITIHKPETGLDLVTWGDRETGLNFCTGDHAYAVAAGQEIIFLVKYKGRDMGCGLIQGKQLIQLLGKKNSNMADKVRWPLFDALVAAGVINNDKSGWGLGQVNGWMHVDINNNEMVAEIDNDNTQEGN